LEYGRTAMGKKAFVDENITSWLNTELIKRINASARVQHS